MARSFSSKDAARFITEHQQIQSGLNQIQTKIQLYRKEVEDAADELVASEVMHVLNSIPIEAVNKDKYGIRVKALRDYGYETIADIATAGVYQIATVRGISEDSAYTIRSIVDDIVDEARKGMKVRISVDRKTDEASDLIESLARLRELKSLSEEVCQIQSEYDKKIKSAIEDLKPGTSGIRWLFTSKVKKQKAEEAFAYLRDLYQGNYRNQAKELLNSAELASGIPSYQAWNLFQENSVSFFNLLEDIAPGVLGTSDAVYGLPEDLAREVQDEAFFPEGLLCDLRRYQEWGVKYILHQERVLLGDEMGLGKTVQAIAAMVSLKNTGATHFVVVCPASVLTNWCREIAGKSKLRVTKVHGAGRSNALKAWISTGGVAVTTYETTGYFK